MKTVSILVPAYNEEASLPAVLDSLLQQNTSNFKLEKIYVVDSASTDKTGSIIHSYQEKNSIIEGVFLNVRKGKMYALNIMFEKVESDIIIPIDADVKIEDEYFIQKLVDQFTDGTVGAVSCSVRPLPPKNFLQKIFYAEEMVWLDIVTSLGANGIRYTYSGRAMAQSKKIYKIIANNKPNIIEDDMYAFYTTVAQGYIPKYAESAFVYYMLPGTIKEYLQQRIRYRTLDISKHFSQDNITKYEAIRFKDKVKYFSIHLIKHPILISLVIALYIASVIYDIWYTPKVIWDVAETSKKL